MKIYIIKKSNKRTRIIWRYFILIAFNISVNVGTMFTMNNISNTRNK